jgi:hypothetical protein
MAVHEASHAVIAEALGVGVVCVKMTRAGGGLTRFDSPIADPLDWMRVNFAGILGEERACGFGGSFVGSDDFDKIEEAALEAAGGDPTRAALIRSSVLEEVRTARRS